MQISHRERVIFDRIAQYKPLFLECEKKTGVPSDLAMSILFVELQQYELKNAVTALKVLKNKICKINAFNCVVGQWMKPVSVGLCHIKELTVFRAVPWSNGHLDPKDIKDMNSSPEASIRVLFGVLSAHWFRWYKDFDLKRRPDVWATLFNICDFDRIQPHNDPKPGGSEAPIHIDGTLIHSIPFGVRVVMVMNSYTFDCLLK